MLPHPPQQPVASKIFSVEKGKSVMLSVYHPSLHAAADLSCHSCLYRYRFIASGKINKKNTKLKEINNQTKTFQKEL